MNPDGPAGRCPTSSRPHVAHCRSNASTPTSGIDKSPSGRRSIYGSSSNGTQVVAQVGSGNGLGSVSTKSGASTAGEATSPTSGASETPTSGAPVSLAGAVAGTEPQAEISQTLARIAVAW